MIGATRTESRLAAASLRHPAGEIGDMIMTEKCLVRECDNHKGEGTFVGDLCGPCHHMLMTGEIRHGATFVHEMRDALVRACADLKIMSSELARDTR